MYLVPKLFGFLGKVISVRKSELFVLTLMLEMFTMQRIICEFIFIFHRLDEIGVTMEKIVCFFCCVAKRLFERYRKLRESNVFSEVCSGHISCDAV
jgi:hypothetical protein